MIRRITLLCLCATYLLSAVACSKRASTPQLLVQIPPGFSGNFVLDMGVRGASPLQKKGEDFVVTVPRSGKVETSTFLQQPNVAFKNGSDGRIWGYSQSMFTTGDGISIGGKIEFFVGTQKEFEAEQNKKNKSWGTPTLESVVS